MNKVELIIKTVAESNEVSVLDLKRKCKKDELVYARAQVYFFLKDYGLTLQKIGDLIGKRNHSTVIHGLNIHNDLMCTSKEYRLLFSETSKRVKEIPDLFLAVINKKLINKNSKLTQ